MKIEMINRGYSYHLYSVVLEGEETSWTDRRIITATDRRGNLTEEEWRSIDSGEFHPGHFGGRVGRSDEDKNVCLVTVYVD